jgi:hypothetical protein
MSLLQKDNFSQGIPLGVAKINLLYSGLKDTKFYERRG